MRQAAGLFVGMKDFRSFSDQDAEETSTRVLVDRVDLKEDGALVLIRMQGSHFIWKMVRRVVGVLAEVGRGALREEDVVRFLSERSGAPARLTAPPSGLFLERVFYPGDERDLPLRAVTNLAEGP
jgi:tRNA pseudouridine38-40 synthase